MRNLHSQVRIRRNEFLMRDKHMLNSKTWWMRKTSWFIDDYAARMNLYIYLTNGSIMKQIIKKW